MFKRGGNDSQSSRTMIATFFVMRKLTGIHLIWDETKPIVTTRIQYCKYKESIDSCTDI